MAELRDSSESLDWSKVLEFYLHWYNGFPRMKKIVSPLAPLFHLITKACDLPLQIDTDILFFRTLHRPDYDNLFAAIVGACHKRKQIVELRYRWKAGVLGLWRGVRCYRSLRSLLQWDLPGSLYVYLQYVRCLEILDRITGYRAVRLVLFADMQPIENMVSQIFSRRGCETVTLQHALFVDYGDVASIRSLNYRNIVSHWFLAWGEETRQLVERYHKNAVRVAICGKPILAVDRRDAAVNVNERFFSLVLDYDDLAEYNATLLLIGNEISQRLGLPAHIRFHPWGDANRYTIPPGMQQSRGSIECSEFVIGHTSSLLFDLMRIGLPVFHLASPVPRIPIADVVVFHTADDLAEKLGHHFDFPTIATSAIACTGEESLRRYMEFFDGTGHAL